MQASFCSAPWANRPAVAGLPGRPRISAPRNSLPLHRCIHSFSFHFPVVFFLSFAFHKHIFFVVLHIYNVFVSLRFESIHLIFSLAFDISLEFHRLCYHHRIRYMIRIDVNSIFAPRVFHIIAKCSWLSARAINRLLQRRFLASRRLIRKPGCRYFPTFFIEGLLLQFFGYCTWNTIFYFLHHFNLLEFSFFVVSASAIKTT